MYTNFIFESFNMHRFLFEFPHTPDTSFILAPKFCAYWIAGSADPCVSLYTQEETFMANDSNNLNTDLHQKNKNTYLLLYIVKSKF